MRRFCPQKTTNRRQKKRSIDSIASNDFAPCPARHCPESTQAEPAFENEIVILISLMKMTLNSIFSDGDFVAKRQEM